MGTRRVSFLLKIAKSTGEPLKTVSAVEMKSFREEDGRLVWREHPVLGDSFTVTVERMVVAEGVEWGIAYEGNETDWFVEEVSFPEWAVPRTDGTKVFVPRICGMVMAPDWKKAPPRQVVAWQGPGFGAPHCIAALGEEGASFYLDQRGEARFHSTRFEIAQGVKPGTCVLKSICILPITAESRRAYRVTYPSWRRSSEVDGSRPSRSIGSGCMGRIGTRRRLRATSRSCATWRCGCGTGGGAR